MDDLELVMHHYVQQINFNGTWFTEQYIVIKSKYKDYSTRLQMLKMIVESGSFETITLNASYRRVQAFTYSNFLVKYGEDPYSLIMQLNFKPDNIKSSICEMRLQLKEKVYWLNTILLVKQPLMVQVEIHLDKNCAFFNNLDTLPINDISSHVSHLTFAEIMTFSSKSSYQIENYNNIFSEKNLVNKAKNKIIF
ncbi:uncharacterized protein LOC118736032 [Rhagoletis pomonella]|uniref:uncharacterized protein LOC118736032 n=1 Tax=Rhagoletis pomonella TaxID=28610 RepID=UPI001781C9F6|nr:uncharacterized protein LOC118736032 [Rhagoletis pomonella]